MKQPLLPKWTQNYIIDIPAPLYWPGLYWLGPIYWSWTLIYWVLPGHPGYTPVTAGPDLTAGTAVTAGSAARSILA